MAFCPAERADDFGTESEAAMSDVSQGEGWWLASDGKWYPPESVPGPPSSLARNRGMRDGRKGLAILAVLGLLAGVQLVIVAMAPTTAAANASRPEIIFTVLSIGLPMLVIVALVFIVVRRRRADSGMSA